MFIKAFLNNNDLKSSPKSRSQLHQRAAHAELHIYKYLLETFAVVNGTQLYIFDFEFHVALLHQSYHRNNRKFLSLHIKGDITHFSFVLIRIYFPSLMNNISHNSIFHRP